MAVAPDPAAGIDVEQVIADLRASDDPTAFLSSLDADVKVAVVQSMTVGLPDDAKRELQHVTGHLAQTWRPRDDDDLWRFIRDECGIEIPRVAVCEGHCAPFEFVGDVYFERGNMDKLAIGNRGSGKTEDMAVLHAANSRTKPGHEGTTVGSVLSQAERCYGYFSAIVGGWAGGLLKGEPQQRETEFRNGAKVQIVTGTITGVNSPHPHLAHFDEVELFRPGVYEEGLNMAQGGRGYRAMNVLTSSWKKAKGFVTERLKEVEDAIREGNSAPYQVYRWCVWETAKQCDADCEECPFHNVVKGKWPDGSKRTFEDVCKGWESSADRRERPYIQGKLKRSRGFVAVEDAVGRFRKLTKRTWESQQESRKPTTEGLIYDIFDEDEQGVWLWDPDPDNGPISLSVDFGGSNPHAVGFWQTLAVEVEHVMPDGTIKRIPEGTHVLFDEIYRADIGNVALGVLVNERILQWDNEWPGFRNAITDIFRDVAAKAAALDWAKMGSFGGGEDPLYMALPTRAIGGVDVDTAITYVYDEIIGKRRLYADRVRCGEFFGEIGSYERNPATGKPVKSDDHHMDGMRYRFWQIHIRERKRTEPGHGPAAAPGRRAVTTVGGVQWNPDATPRPYLGGEGRSVVVAPRKHGIGMS